MRLKIISSFFQAFLFFCAATIVNGEDDTAGLIVKRNVSGDSVEELTPEAFTNMKNKVGSLESSITNMTVGIQQLVRQNEELYRSFVTMMSKTIPEEFGQVKEQLSALENRLAGVENTCKSFDRTNETRGTESSLPRLDDSCGGDIAVEDFGEIIYKKEKLYSNNENCVWTVNVADAGMISFELVTSGFEDCCDYITVNSIDQDGVSTGPSSKLTSENRTCSVKGSRAKVKFSSDGSITGNGFALRFRSRLAHDGECGGAIIGGRGVISYKSGLKYLNNERCVWILHSPNSNSIKLKLLENGFERCCDYLVVNTIDPETGWIRNGNDTHRITEQSKTYTIEESLIVILFYSDHSDSGNGFTLEFSSSGENPNPEINFIVKHISERNGTVEYPSPDWNKGREGKNIYVVGFSETVEVSGTIPTVIDWTYGIFQSSTTDSCVYDSLSIYEPVRYGWIERTRVPNQTDCERLVTVPPEKELLTFSKHSFIAIFKPLFNENNQTPTRFSFSYHNQANSDCGGDLEPLQGEFGHISYKESVEYRSNENCTWAVQVPQAQRILFSLLKSGLESCCDRVFVNLYNSRSNSTFELTSDRSGNRTVSVEGPTATVTFLSDKSINGLGFLLRYQKEI